MSGLMLLVATWNCWISYKNRNCLTVGSSPAASLEPLAHHQNVACLVFSIGTNMVDVHLNWPNWVQFLIFQGGLFVILTVHMIFL